jgi:predicted protein tyrosine phosphatase
LTNKIKEDIVKLINKTTEDNNHLLLIDHNRQISIHLEDLNFSQDQQEIQQETIILSVEDFSTAVFQVSSEKPLLNDFYINTFLLFFLINFNFIDKK